MITTSNQSLGEISHLNKIQGYFQLEASTLNAHSMNTAIFGPLIPMPYG